MCELRGKAARGTRLTTAALRVCAVLHAGGSPADELKFALW